MAGESDLAHYRVTLFVGPESVKGKPSTQHCVFNVKKRSWKGGVQVAVEIVQDQIDAIAQAIAYTPWLITALRDVPDEARASYQARAGELLVQALCRCKLDVVLQSGISQENQCLSADTDLATLREAALARSDRLTSFIAAELDLAQDNFSDATR